MSKIKVLHIIDYLQTTGGAERRLLNDLALMDKNIISNHVCCINSADKNILNDLNEGGIKIHTCPEKNYFVKLFYLINLIKQIKPDIIHTQLFYSDVLGVIAAKICKVPTIISTIQNSVHEPKVKYYYIRHRRLMYVLISGLFTQFIAVSEFVKQSMSKRLFINPEKISVLYNYAINNEIKNNNINNKIKTKEKKHKDLVLCCVGKINPAKGQLELIQAVSKLIQDKHNIKLIIAGDGPSRKKCEQEARELGIADKVEFLGNITNVSEVLGSSDAFIFPTHSEGLPLALLEAVLAKLPCIISSIPPNFEVIKPENRFYFEPNNTKEIENAIKEFINAKHEEPLKIKKMVEDAVINAKRKFDPATTVKKLEEIYLKYDRGKNKK